MSTGTQRPSIQRKHTRSTKAKQDAELDETFAIRVDGEVYKITPADLTGAQEFRIRQATGMSVTQVITNLQAAPGVDMLGVFMWIARTTAGEKVELMEVLESISYASDLDIVEDAEPDSPEA